MPNYKDGTFECRCEKSFRGEHCQKGKCQLKSVTPGTAAGKRGMVQVLTVHWFVLKFATGYVLVKRLGFNRLLSLGESKCDSKLTTSRGINLNVLA